MLARGERCQPCPVAEGEPCTGTEHRVVCEAARAIGVDGSRAGGKRWGRIETEGKARVERYGTDQAPGVETRRLRNANPGRPLDDELMGQIQAVAERFENLPARLDGEYRDRRPGRYLKPRPDRVYVAIYLIREATRLPWATIAEALDLKVGFVRGAIPKGRRLIEEAAATGRLDDAI